MELIEQMERAAGRQRHYSKVCLLCGRTWLVECLELRLRMDGLAAEQRTASPSAATASAASQALLAFLGIVLCAIYVFFGLRQLFHPFQTPHQARFAGHLRAHSVLAADLGGAATALLAVAAALAYPGHQARGSWKSLLSLAALLASLEAVFWGVAILRVAEHNRVRVAAAALTRAFWAVWLLAERSDGPGGAFN